MEITKTDKLSAVNFQGRSCKFSDGGFCFGEAKPGRRCEYVRTRQGTRGLLVSLDLAGESKSFPGWRFSAHVQCELFKKKKAFGAVCRNMEQAVESVLRQVSGNYDESKTWSEGDRKSVQTLLEKMIRRCLRANAGELGALVCTRPSAS